MSAPTSVSRYAAIAVAAALTLTGCTASEISSPVGEWVAIGDDHGALSINPDGTFVMTESSYNPLEYRHAENDFNATGTWQLAHDDTEVALDFESAAQGSDHVEPRLYFVPFRSGTLRFEDPEGTADIELRLTPTPSGGGGR